MILNNFLLREATYNRNTVATSSTSSSNIDHRRLQDFLPFLAFLSLLTFFFGGGWATPKRISHANSFLRNTPYAACLAIEMAEFMFREPRPMPIAWSIMLSCLVPKILPQKGHTHLLPLRYRCFPASNSFRTYMLFASLESVS